MLSRWFHKKEPEKSAVPEAGLVGPRFLRQSGGWAALRRRLESEDGLRVLDVGFTSPANVQLLTSLGHSVYLADPVDDAWSGDWSSTDPRTGSQIWQIEPFLDHCFPVSRPFDVVFLWTALDYLAEPLVAPTVERLFCSMAPCSQVLAIFHTRMQGEEAQRCRFHLTATDQVEIQLARQIPLQRCFSNRGIEKLFAGWASHRQFLAKDNLIEVLLTR